MTKHKAMDPLLLIGSIIILAAILTWIIPAGHFERTQDASTGRTMVVPGSFKNVPRNPIGPWRVLTSIPDGLAEAASIVFYVFLAGGALTVVEATGAVGNTLDHLMWRFGNRPMLILVLASALFLFGGATYGMYEEILAFVPLLCALMRRLGFGNEMALAISLGTTSVAQSFSPFETFHLAISQPIAGLPLFSGFAFRGVIFLVAIAIWCGYLAWYARRNRHAPALYGEETMPHVTHWRRSDMAVLLILSVGMIAIVIGGAMLHWELTQFAAVLTLVGIVAGLAGGLGWRGTSQQFAEGFRRLAFAALLVGFARAISVVLANGLILDTIANALFSPLRHLPLSASAIMMFISQLALGFPIPSDSGRAMMSLPILIPIADLLGLSRQMVVSAFQYGSLAANLLAPTAGAMLAMLAMAGVPFSKWLRFLAVPFTLLVALCVAAMIIGVRLGVQ
jgi:uncharacterized ion transporter superfamily protein YfcC